MKTLLINGKIYGSENTSIGFDSGSGKINYIGNVSINSDFDNIIDVRGKLILSAFTDAHVHLFKGSQVNSELNLRNCSCYNELKTSLQQYLSNVKLNKENFWISGGYFAESNFKDDFKITKKTLDELIPDTPVILSRFDHHSGVANSKALNLSRIVEFKNDFMPEELIEENGELTGEVKERALYFILNKIPQKTLSEKAADLRKLISQMHTFGITCVGDITLPADLDVYEECLRSGKLGMNINCILPFEEFKNIDQYKKRFAANSELRFGCFKAFYDGSLSSKTAYYFDNYKGTESNGLRTEIVNSGRFEELAIQIDKAGYQIAVHAIGDKAVSELLDLNVKLNSVNGRRDRRFRIEHAQHIHEKDIKRFKELGIIASIQPTHLFSDASTSTRLLQHPEREHSYKKVIDEGGKFILGTDYPIVEYSPFITIYYAVTRKGEGFPEGFHNENRLTIEECIEGYTVNNAYSIYLDGERGKLEQGFIADIIVLDKNIFEIDENEIREIKVEMTVKNGAIIYSC